VKTILGAILFVFSVFAAAQAPSGKWTGNAAPNLGDPSRCAPNMAFELVVENGRLTGKLDFGNRVQAIEAAVAADGKFETTFVNPFGHTLQVSGKLDDAFTVNNPIRCGYGNIPLKR
jgi:hypothetical protein